MEVERLALSPQVPASSIPRAGHGEGDARQHESAVAQRASVPGVRDDTFLLRRPKPSRVHVAQRFDLSLHVGVGERARLTANRFVELQALDNLVPAGAAARMSS